MPKNWIVQKKTHTKYMHGKYVQYIKTLRSNTNQNHLHIRKPKIWNGKMAAIVGTKYQQTLEKA